MAKPPVLCAFNQITAVPTKRGTFILAERMIDGMEKYGEFWDGDMIAVVEPGDLMDDDRALSGANQEVDLNDLSFRCEVVDFESEELYPILQDSSIVLCGIGYRSLHLGNLCKKFRIPLVWGSEYTLKTRLQVIASERRNPVKRLRGYQWEIVNEFRQVRAIRKGIGIQCNGTPTYDAYKHLTPNPLLFFDGRTRDDQIIKPDQLEQRLNFLMRGQPLRLAWSGRLNKMKGADHLIKVAVSLKRLGVPFSLRIFGDGVLARQLNKEVQELGLSNNVKLEGYVPFNEELVPLMKQEVDIWLCCHVQGDPSGAYLETLGFGLPIIGYDNEAFAGILKHAGNIGESAKIGKPEALALAVKAAHLNRDKVAEWSRNAISFASNHTFDKSFERRVQHFELCMKHGQ